MLDAPFDKLRKRPVVEFVETKSPPLSYLLREGVGGEFFLEARRKRWVLAT